MAAAPRSTSFIGPEDFLVVLVEGVASGLEATDNSFSLPPSEVVELSARSSLYGLLYSTWSPELGVANTVVYSHFPLTDHLIYTPAIAVYSQ